MNSLNILHVSNVLLGKYLPEFGIMGKEVRKIIRNNFVSTVKKEIKSRRIDVLVITNNLFGTNMYSTMDTRAVIDLFSEIELPVFIIPGELDKFNDISIYNKLDFSHNVSVFKEKKEAFDHPGYDDVVFTPSKDPQSPDPGIKIIFQQTGFEFEFYSSVEKFSETSKSVLTPSLSICDSDEFVQPGYSVVSIKEKNRAKVEFVRAQSILKNNIQITVNDLKKKDIENTIREYAGKNSILFVELIGKINNLEVLSEIFKVHNRNKDDFLLLKVIDNTIISREYLDSLPSHLEPSIFANMVQKTMKEDPDKQELYKKIIKRGLYFYNT